MSFDIAGQKAYVKHGPYRNRIGIIQREGRGVYALVMNDGAHVHVEFQDLVLVDVDYRDFHEWCEQNGYI
ncbi:DUF3912 family protein [Ectobacillus ponti]|uniref:DUF3912 family protein n=1 Tax=Ectobacillus ponti TaxID=2961894 RepID=A0AA42BN49_9BACI|nr:DUF3912 family protein [Ectobacillus ponti]